MGTIKPGRKPSSVGRNIPSAVAREAIADALRSEVHSWGLAQARAAARLGIHRANLNRLLRGDLSRFALGSLMDMAVAAGIQVEFIIRDPMAQRGAPQLSQLAPARLFEQIQRDQAKLLFAANQAPDVDTGVSLAGGRGAEGRRLSGALPARR